MPNALAKDVAVREPTTASSGLSNVMSEAVTFDWAGALEPAATNFTDALAALLAGVLAGMAQVYGGGHRVGWSTVTRIISGFAGSREIKVAREGTRPTSDMVREAIFSALESRDVITGARVLDLYAGSGALGLEALSRGASSVVLVEKGIQAGKLLRVNAEMVRAVGGLSTVAVSVAVTAVSSYLASLNARGAQGSGFDLVFIDPPYDMAEEEVATALAALVPALNDEAIVILERSTRSPAPTLPEGLELDRKKKHGETTIWWLENVITEL
jgi:16S rRNA (guanine966-N2)-methyltransferase